MVEVLAKLKPDAGQAERIAATLGLGWSAVQISSAPVPTSAAASSGAPTPDLRVSAATVRPAPREITPARPATTKFELRVGAGEAAASGPLAAAEVRVRSARLPYRPLFAERRWRTLARSMLATLIETSKIDLRIVIRHLRTGRPIERLPWLLRPTLRRGVILVLDRSQSMQPFWRDESELIERCRRVVGAPGVRAYLVETDVWSDAGPRLRWLQPEPEYFAPQTPIVIVSDFELGRELIPRSALVDPWLPLIERAKSAGAIVLALIPVERALWPAALTEMIPNAVVWDNDTTTYAVRRSLAQNA
jgi:hypothetical protein